MLDLTWNAHTWASFYATKNKAAAAIVILLWIVETSANIMPRNQTQNQMHLTPNQMQILNIK